MTDYSNEYNSDLFKLGLMQRIERFGEENFVKKFPEKAKEYLQILKSEVPLHRGDSEIILYRYGIKTYKDFYEESDELARDTAYEKKWDADFALARQIGLRLDFLQKDAKLSNPKAAALFATTPEIWKAIKDFSIIHRIAEEQVSQETVNGILQKAVKHFNDPQLSRLYQKLDASYVPPIEHSNIGNIVEAVRTAPLIGTAKQIEEKPIKDLLATTFIKNFGTMTSQKTETKTR